MAEEPEKTRLVTIAEVAGECRAAARRLGLIRYERDHLTPLLSEADRHEEVVGSVSIDPVFSLTPVSARPRCVLFLARYVSPMGDARLWGTLGEPGEAFHVACDAHEGHPLPKVMRDSQIYVHLGVEGRMHALGKPLPRTVKMMTFSPEELEMLVSLLQGALLSLSDHLVSGESRSETSGSASEPLNMDADATDALQMLWDCKAFGESKAVSVRIVAPTRMPKRKHRLTPSTYLKAAERGVKQLRAKGLVDARPNVGTWLSETGLRMARQMFDRDRGWGRVPTR